MFSFVSTSIVNDEEERPVPEGELAKLEQFLRPTFKSTPADVANQELRQLKMNQLLRDQQKPVLSLFKNQDRLVLDGPAGTGKSLIALEVARRMRDRKLRTGLLCFNQKVWHRDLASNLAASESFG